MLSGEKALAAIIVMGVSGSGKTSVAEALAKALDLHFVEGDGLHPASNVEKMSHGIPLTDEDRMPWLDLIGAEIAAATEGGRGIVVSCSALKKIYRDRLRREAGGPLYFVFLEGSKALLLSRLSARKGHFMPPSLLESQLQTLEVPTGEPGVVTVGIAATVEGIAAAAVEALAALP
jgi:gluconokinase